MNFLTSKTWLVFAVICLIGGFAKADNSRQGLDKKCITQAIEYVNHPVVSQAATDTIFAGFKTGSLEAFDISEKEIEVLVQPLIRKVNYAMVTAMCSVYSLEEVNHMNELLKDDMYVTIVSKQSKMFTTSSMLLVPEVMELQTKLSDLIIEKLS